MKKFIVFALVLALAMTSVFAMGLAEDMKAQEAAAAAVVETPVVETVAPVVAGPATYTFGMGITFDDEQSNDTTAAYDAVVAAVVLDAEGRIVAVQIDDAQNKMTKDDVDPEKTFKSKYELQYDYNMVKFSEATNEWFEQAAAFEDYCAGKTAAEIADLATRVRTEAEPHPGYVVTADEELFASCSMSITSFKEAVVKACADTKAKTFTTDAPFCVGLKVSTTAEESTDEVIKMYANFGAVVVDENGVILAALLDAIQPQFKVEDDAFTFKGTKKELEFGYNMVKFSEATNEWFEQAAAFEDYCAGKTGAEVATLATRVRTADEPHPGYVVTADEELFASCSIQIVEFKSVLAQAAGAEPVVEAVVEGPATYTFGMGITFSDEQSNETTAAYDAVTAAVVLDAEGRIVAVQIDDAQNKMTKDDVDPEKTFKSKYELQYDYNMVKFSEATNEWFEQAAAFEDYCAGKTAAEIADLATRVRTEAEPHPGYVVTADEELFASCSMSITSFKEAVVKACNDTKAKTFTTDAPFTVGLKISTTAEESTDEVIKMYANFGAVVVDENGVILAALLDAIQPQYKVEEEAFTFKGTKKELEFGYNMVKFSEATNEWFEQAAAFEDYCVGKTGAEVATLATRVRTADEPHPGYVVTADEELFASCSIQIVEFKSVLAQAAGAEAVAPATYTLGMGITFDDEQSNETTAAYDAVVATVVLDAEGKIVAVQIDDAQNKMTKDDVDPEKTFKSKYELQYDYNMVKFSEATNEWFEQAAAFEDYCAGKTAAEIADLATRVRTEAEPHPGYVVTADEELFASCSMSITSFKEAVVKACNDTKAKTFTTDAPFCLGVAVNTKADESTDEVIKMYAEFGAAVVSADGTVLACLTDAIQPQFKVEDDAFTFKGTKKELEFDYNMVKFSEATNEWFEQAAAFEDYCAGKTAAEIADLATRVRTEAEPHPGYVVTADEELFASCSMQITGMKAVISKAANNAN
ncbi:MAG: hypothetical protein MJ057_03315 [Sphaerochaetaceae bacterium]|nr:hypothetical protein [Sphaerochaetaceae bacterium]